MVPPAVRYLEPDDRAPPDAAFTFFVDPRTGERFAVANLVLQRAARGLDRRTSRPLVHAVKPPARPGGGR